MKTNTLLRRLIVSALCAAMVISMLPVTVFANRDVDDSENNPPPPATEYVEPTVPGSTSAPRYILQFVMGEDGYASNNGSVTVSYTTNSGTGSVTVDLYEGYMKLFPNYSYSNLTKDVQRLADKGMAVNGTLIDGIAQSFTGTYYDTTERNLDAYSTYTVSLDNIPYGVTSIDSVSVSLDDKDSLSLQSLQVISVTSWLLYADTDTHSLDYLRRYWNGSYGSELVGSWSGQLVAEASGTCNGGTTTTFSTKNNKLTYYSNNRTVVDNSGSSMQGVSIHIADFYDAGIESLLAGYSRTEKTAADSKDKFNAADFLSIGKQAYSAYSNLDPIIKDCLTLEVTYLDTMGHTRKVKIPFITAYLTNILLANKGVLCGNDDYNTWISGIFQQNETVALQLRLAQYESLVGLKLTYGETVDYAASRGNAKTVNTSTDKLTVDSICFYENVTAQNFTLPYDKSHLACMLETDLTPAYSYTSSNSAGATLATGHQLNVTLENGRLINGSPEEKELENTYVFTLTNSSVSSAGTLSSIHLDITYVDNNGFEHTLEDLNLENLVGQFYGYTFNFDVLAWKKANVAGNYDGSQADNRNRDLYQQYDSHMNTVGGITQFAITASNVAYFSSVSFTISKSGTSINQSGSSSATDIDSWQLAGITVTKATAISQRYSTKKVDGGPYWLREAEGKDVAWSNQRMLLQAGALSQTIFLTYVDSDGNIVKPEKTIMENEYLDTLPSSMTYQDTLKELGFTVPKFTYQIAVDVAKVTDAGSTNYFYFQLIFENGASAVVLANQQLSSDSFREGCTETFQIQTTQNYGKLSSVRIICDSASSTSNVFDKLNISNVSVTLVGSTGVSRVWNINNIGWIDINYADEGSVYYSGNSDVIVPAETTNVQLVREYAVTGISTAVDLQFCIATNKAVSNHSGAYSSSLKGTFSAVLTYLDSTGTQKTKPFDLINQLKNYNATDEEDWLLRGNHTDRFILSLPDISSIISMEIIRSGGAADWLVDSISIQQVGETGGVYIAYNEEYVRDSEVSVELTKSDQTGTVTISGNDSYTFAFTSNTISISSSDDDSWNATISREPTTTNDTLNVYLYSGKVLGTDYPFTANTAIKASLKYNTRYGGAMQTSFTFQRGTSGGKSVMYAEGISVSDMATLHSMTLNDQSAHSYSTVVDHAVVERVRNGVIIDTYRINYGNFLEYAVESKPTDAIVNPMQQKVTLQSAAGQPAVPLTAETYDVAVALRYTSLSSMDGQKKVYQSPYIYLTDQQITALSSNQNVELIFDVCNVDEIVALSVVSTGPAFVYDGAMVVNCDQQNGAALKSYSADSGFTASTIETTVDLTGAMMSTAVFTFMTPANTEVAGAGTFGQVSMIVTYTNSAGETVTRNFDDLISRLPTGSSFSSGTTTELTLLLPDAVSINSVTLYAPDDDWYLSTVGVALTQSDGTVENKAVRTNSWAKMLTPLEIDLNAGDSVILGLSVTAYSQRLQQTSYSEGISYMVVNARPGDLVTLTPSMSYSGTPDTTWVWNPGNWTDNCVTTLDNALNFRVPEDAQAGSGYLLTVSATADPSINVTIMIRITTASTAATAMEVTCTTKGTDQTVTGSMLAEPSINAYVDDTIIIAPTWNGEALVASEWTWDLTNAVGVTYVDASGQLEWSLMGEASVGDIIVIRISHNETGAQISILVTIIGTSSAKNIHVIAEATGTQSIADSETGDTVYIDAYSDDTVYITPYVGGEILSTDAWEWEPITENYLFKIDSNGRAEVNIYNFASIGDAAILKAVHLDSGKTITIIMTIVVKETSASSVSVTANVESSGTEVSGVAGTTLNLEATVNDTITLIPYFDGELASGNEWEWDLTEVRYYAAKGSQGHFTLTFRDQVEAGTVLTTTLTHIASGLKVTVVVTIIAFDEQSNPLTLSAATGGTLEYYEIKSGETVNLNAWVDDQITIAPMVNGKTTEKADWTYSCSKDASIKYDVSADGVLLNYKIEGYNMQPGDTIVFTVTHVESDVMFTVVVTIVDYSS